jgi:hypothetical protein
MSLVGSSYQGSCGVVSPNAGANKPLGVNQRFPHQVICQVPGLLHIVWGGAHHHLLCGRATRGKTGEGAENGCNTGKRESPPSTLVLMHVPWPVFFGSSVISHHSTAIPQQLRNECYWKCHRS